jgi:HemY protein
MRRALKFIVILVVLLALAWWIGSLPGSVTAHSGSYTVETSVPAAVLLLFLAGLIVVVVLRLLGAVRRAPRGFGAWRGGRRQRLGQTATERGIVALAAGDAAGARAEAGRAAKLLGDTPLVLLLRAEAARLAGLPAEAQAAFKQLTNHPGMAFLGHRGLLRQSAAVGDHEVAQIHAEAAEAAYPGSAWLKNKRRELALARQDYPAALALTREPRHAAALATAAARSAADPRAALGFARQAVKADPALAPAVVALAESLRAADKPRAATKALLEGWKTAPHRMLAAAYFAGFGTPIERAQAAGALAAQNPGHVESELALAETALEAKLAGEARRHAEAARALGGDQGRAAAVLAALDGAPPPAIAPAAWTCEECYSSFPGWAASCPNCHKIGTLKPGAPGTHLA